MGKALVWDTFPIAKIVGWLATLGPKHQRETREKTPRTYLKNLHDLQLHQSHIHLGLWSEGSRIQGLGYMGKRDCELSDTKMQQNWQTMAGVGIHLQGINGLHLILNEVLFGWSTSWQSSCTTYKHISWPELPLIRFPIPYVLAAFVTCKIWAQMLLLHNLHKLGRKCCHSKDLCM
jgi:hypothetical protein